MGELALRGSPSQSAYLLRSAVHALFLEHGGQIVRVVRDQRLSDYNRYSAGTWSTGQNLEEAIAVTFINKKNWCFAMRIL
jgi:hypothetical protein